MATDLTFNYSETALTEFLNSTNTTTESMYVQETWANAEIARLIQIIVRPILITIGTVGNGLTAYVLRRSTLKNLSPCFYMFFLAIADTSKWNFFVFSKAVL